MFSIENSINELVLCSDDDHFSAIKVRLMVKAIQDELYADSHPGNGLEYSCARLIASLIDQRENDELFNAVDAIFDSLHFMDASEELRGIVTAVTFLLSITEFHSNQELVDYFFTSLSEKGMNNLHNQTHLLIHKQIAAYGKCSDKIQTYYLSKGDKLLSHITSSQYLSENSISSLNSLYKSKDSLDDDSITDWANNPACSLDCYRHIAGIICRDLVTRDIYFPILVSNHNLNEERTAILNEVANGYRREDFDCDVMSPAMMSNVTKMKLGHLLKEFYFTSSCVDSTTLFDCLKAQDKNLLVLLSHYDGKTSLGSQSSFAMSDRIKIMSFLNNGALASSYKKTVKTPFILPAGLFPKDELCALLLSFSVGKNGLEQFCDSLKISEGNARELLLNYIISLAGQNYKARTGISIANIMQMKPCIVLGMNFEKCANLLIKNANLDLSSKCIGLDGNVCSLLDVVADYDLELEFLVGMHIDGLSNKIAINNIKKTQHKRFL